MPNARSAFSLDLPENLSSALLSVFSQQVFDTAIQNLKESIALFIRENNSDDFEKIESLLKQFAKLETLSIDSREITDKAVFVAVKGASANGQDFIPVAVKSGCCCIINGVVNDEVSNDSAPLRLMLDELNGQRFIRIVVPEVESKLPSLAKWFYFTRASGLEVPELIAVTGTNGKTSIASFIAQLYAMQGQKSASIGTLGVNIFSFNKENTAQTFYSENIADTKNTSVDIVSCYAYLKQLVDKGVCKIAIEASSHGLEQGRLEGLPIAHAVFSNLSQDHLDYHKTMANYAKAKRRLLEFNSLKSLALNADDPESTQWHKKAPAFIEKICWYSCSEDFNSEQYPLFCHAQNIKYTQSGCSLNIASSWGEETFTLPLIGGFNIANCLAALSILLMQGIPLSSLAHACSKLEGAKGRMELFSGQSCNILIDYAHTPEALKNALIAARRHTAARLICVFGCGGDRDSSKRAIMGQVATEQSDIVIVTEDNSRSENIRVIVDDILSGISTKDVGKKVIVEIERKSAINKAINICQSNDLILLAGKGHETYTEKDGKKLYYDERQYVSQLLCKSTNPTFTQAIEQHQEGDK